MAYSSDNKPSKVFLTVNEKAEENPKAPVFKGFINLTPEMVAYIKDAVPDSYNTVKVELSLWYSKDKEGNYVEGKYSGNVSEPYKKSAAPAPKSKLSNVPTDDF